MVQLFQEHLPGQTGESARGLHELLLDDVLSLNGKASIHQMHRGVERLREHGGKPPSPEALLQEYQRRLDAIIEERTEAILSRSEEHTSELQSLRHLVCRLLL